jgi:hypothetical protein
MVMAMVAMAGRKYRAGKHQQKQGCCKNLFHAPNVARSARREKRIWRSVSRRERGAGSGSNTERPTPTVHG